MIQPACLRREWHKKGIHEGAIAEVICSEDEPVYFKYSTWNGVLLVKFMRKATSPEGAILLPAKPTTITLADNLGGAPGVDSEESDGLLPE